jgi:hypothetical protein
MILMNTEVGVCVVLGVAGRWREYRWINDHHHSRYNLLFLSPPHPAQSVSFFPLCWQPRLPTIIRVSALNGIASHLYVCCSNIHLLATYLTFARDCYFVIIIIIGGR